MQAAVIMLPSKFHYSYNKEGLNVTRLLKSLAGDVCAICSFIDNFILIFVNTPTPLVN